jgi:hypothetical protein
MKTKRMAGKVIGLSRTSQVSLELPLHAVALSLFEVHVRNGDPLNNPRVFRNFVLAFFLIFCGREREERRGGERYEVMRCVERREETRVNKNPRKRRAEAIGVEERSEEGLKRREEEGRGGKRRVYGGREREE